MTASRCPACAAAVRVDDPWCTLCYADLRSLSTVAAVAAPASLSSAPTGLPAAPAPAVAPASAAPAAPAVDPADPLGLAPRLPRWSCACGANPTYDELVCPTCGHVLLGSGAPQLAGLERVVKAPKVAVMLGGAALVTVVMVVLFTVVGLLL